MKTMRAKIMSKMGAESGSHLLRMPLVIVRTILKELYKTDREAFFNFRLVSTACRNESEYLLFRSITLHDRTATGQSQSLKLVKRLRDSNETTREYVRLLSIGPFKDENIFETEISQVLEDILRCINNLHALTWNMKCAPPPAMLDLFHELYPSAHLHLILRNRKFEPLSRSLLSSPQLFTLDTEIYRTVPDDTGHSLSELSFIKDNLPPSLRVLRLHSHGVHAYPQRAQFENWEIVKHSRFNFDFQPGDRLPALLELALEHDELFLTPENCNLWARATSWARLQRLDLSGGAPRHFFASLTNRAINLTYLKFFIGSPNGNETWGLYPLSTGLPVLADFTASTPSLHTLDFGMQCLDDVMPTLRVMLQNLQGSLRSLSISCMMEDYSGPIDYVPGMLAWEPEHHKEVLELAPGLEHLDARMGADSVVGDWKGEDRCADIGEKWKTARKKIRGKPKEKKQRSKNAQRLVW